MKRTLASIIGAAALFAGSYGFASAATLADLQAQLQSLLAQIATLQQGPQTIAPYAGAAPDSCKVWYDGCNTCTRTYPGGPLSCTSVQCIWNAGSSCKEYFDTTGSGSSGTPRICTLPYYRLNYGTRGDLVSALQDFLRSEGIFGSSSTGFFGSLTQGALQKWQADHGVVSSGSAATTGWGTLGPATWRAIQARCTPIVGGDRDAHGCIPSAGYSWCASLNSCIRPWEQSCPAATSTPPTACTLQYQPVCGRPSGCMNTCPAGQMCPMYCRLADPQTYGNRCQLDAAGAQYLYDGTCANVNANQPPIVSGITGPTTLSVNQQGTWMVNASDPENQALSYQVTWGDERINSTLASGVASSPINYQSATFTHTYATAGTYTVQVTVTDVQGKSSQASITVTVGSSVVCTMEYAPVCGQPPEPACRHSTPACMIATPGPQTYGNTCLMNAAGATFISNGACAGYSGY